MDWEEYLAETSNSEKLCDLLCTARYDYYLKLVNTMHPLHAFNHTDLPLFYKTDLNHITMQINKIMEKNRVKKNHTMKKI